MSKYRLRLSKTGTAIYISHLDLMHTLQRAFARAGYKLKYSEGFNPHPQISSAMPLSVGTASCCEIVDFALVEELEKESFPSAINRVLPEGIEVLEVYEPESKVSEIKWLQVRGRFEYDRAEQSSVAEGLSEYFSQPSILMVKKSKSGEKETDIRPMIENISFAVRDDYIECTAFVSANEPVLNPDNLVGALRQNRPDLCPDFAAFVRMETFDRNFKIFR